MPSIDGVETTRTGILERRAAGRSTSAEVNPAPPAMTRSGSRPTIFSTSTVPKVTTSGSGLRLGRVVARVVRGDDAVAGADREQGLGHGRGQRDDLLRLGRERDGRALVVGQGHREGRGRGRARGRGRGRGRGGGRGWRRDRDGARGDRGGAAGAGREDEERRTAQTTRVAAAALSGGRTGTGTRTGTSEADVGVGGVAHENAKPLASNGSKEGSSRECARVLPTFLSKVRACTVWSATGLALSEGRSP